MKYELLTTVSLLLISYGQTPETGADTEPSAQGTPAPAQKLPQNVLAMRGVDLYMHDYAPTNGELRDPTFWIHADAGQLAEGEKVWSLQKTKAIIYREDDEDLHLEAIEGLFDQERQEVILKGAVRLSIGSLVVDLEDVVWINEENVATSNRPVHLENENITLDAKSLLIKPGENVLKLGEGSGSIRLKEPNS